MGSHVLFWNKSQNFSHSFRSAVCILKWPLCGLILNHTAKNLDNLLLAPSHQITYSLSEFSGECKGHRYVTFPFEAGRPWICSFRMGKMQKPRSPWLIRCRSCSRDSLAFERNGRSFENWSRSWTPWCSNTILWAAQAHARLKKKAATEITSDCSWWFIRLQSWSRLTWAFRPDDARTCLPIARVEVYKERKQSNEGYTRLDIERDSTPSRQMNANVNVLFCALKRTSMKLRQGCSWSGSDPLSKLFSDDDVSCMTQWLTFWN